MTDPRRDFEKAEQKVKRLMKQLWEITCEFPDDTIIVSSRKRVQVCQLRAETISTHDSDILPDGLMALLRGTPT
jgi:hypothetical protein